MGNTIIKGGPAATRKLVIKHEPFKISADYPNSHDGVDTCVVTQPSGAWSNYHCDHLMKGFICEVVAGIEQPTTAPTPTDSPDIDCNEGQTDGWIRMPGNTFLCWPWPIRQPIFQGPGNLDKILDL